MSTTEMKKSKNLNTVDSEQSVFLPNKQQKVDLIKPTQFGFGKLAPSVGTSIRDKPDTSLFGTSPISGLTNVQSSFNFGSSPSLSNGSAFGASLGDQPHTFSFGTGAAPSSSFGSVAIPISCFGAAPSFSSTASPFSGFGASPSPSSGSSSTFGSSNKPATSSSSNRSATSSSSNRPATSSSSNRSATSSVSSRPATSSVSSRPATFSVSSFTYKSKQSASPPEQTTKTEITNQEKKHKTKNQSNNTQDVQTKKRRYCNIDSSYWDAFFPDKDTHSNHIKKKQSIDAKLDKIFRSNQTENKQIVDIESYLEAIGDKPHNLDFTRGMECARYEITQKILKCLHLS
jgi:hypothetical protein